MGVIERSCVGATSYNKLDGSNETHQQISDIRYQVRRDALRTRAGPLRIALSGWDIIVPGKRWHSANRVKVQHGKL